MDGQNSRDPITALAARQVSLKNGAKRVRTVYDLERDAVGELVNLPAWINRNPTVVSVEVFAGAATVTMAVDSTLYLAEHDARGGLWEALEWWDAWVDHLNADVQLGGAVVSVRVKPQAAGVLAGIVTWNEAKYLGLAMRHEYQYERFSEIG